MANWKTISERLTTLLSLRRPPVAIGFFDAPPAGMAKFSGTEPSSCSYWRVAADGKAFYTGVGDHYNCPVGAYTHNIPLPPERARELEGTLKMMFDAGYIRPEEVPGIPRMAKMPGAIAYAPLAAATFSPDVVVLTCRASGLMLLNEAAQRAGAASSLPLLGRPTCMGIPASLFPGQGQAAAVFSTGCIGNRTYTGATDDELYAFLPASRLEAIADALTVVAAANAAVGSYAVSRRSQLSSE